MRKFYDVMNNLFRFVLDTREKQFLIGFRIGRKKNFGLYVEVKRSISWEFFIHMTFYERIGDPLTAIDICGGKVQFRIWTVWPV